MKEAIEFVSGSKLDTVFTTRSSKTNWRQYNCRENVLDRVNSPKREAYKSHGSASVKTVECHARFNIQKKNLCHCLPHVELTQISNTCNTAREEFIMMGCLGHSHALHCRNKRLSPLTKAFILQKLKDGVPIETILEHHFTKNVSVESEEKIVTYTDIKNISRHHGIGGIDMTSSERQNCLDLLECTGFVGFNWEKTFGASPLPPVLANKLVETQQDFCLIYMDDVMRQRFRTNPYVLSLDTTHCTNRAKYLLMSILTYGKRVQIMIYLV